MLASHGHAPRVEHCGQAGGQVEGEREEGDGEVPGGVGRGVQGGEEGVGGGEGGFKEGEEGEGPVMAMPMGRLMVGARGWAFNERCLEGAEGGVESGWC